jgi:hypothetical protein
MSSLANFFNAMKNVTAIGPEMVPVALEMLKFVVRGFAVGRSLESSIEEAVEAIKKRMENPQPPPPDPSIQVAQIKDKGETDRTKMKIEAEKGDAMEQRQFEYLKGLAEQQSATMQAFMQQLQTQLENNFTRQHETAMQQSEQRAAQESEARAAALKASTDQSEAKLTNISEGLTIVLEQVAELVKVSGKLKKRVPKYDPESGDILEVTEEFIE